MRTADVSQPLLGDPPHRLEVELAGAEHRDRVDLDEVLAAGDEQVGQAHASRGPRGPRSTWPSSSVVQDGELLALALVADGRHGEDLRRRPPIACWSASSTRPCGTISPPIFENRESRPVIFRNPSSLRKPEVARDVPAVVEGRLGEVVAAQVALHHVRPLDQHQALGVGAERLVGVGARPSGPRRPAAGGRRTPPRARLEEARLAVVERVHGDHRGALGHAVALHRADAEARPRTPGPATRAASRPRRAPGGASRTAPGRSAAGRAGGRSAWPAGPSPRSAGPARRSAAASSGLGWQTEADARVGREPEDRVAERVEQRQDRRPAGRSGRTRKTSRIACDVGIDVEVGEDHALGLARAAAAEDDRRGVVDRRPARGAPAARSSSRTGANSASAAAAARSAARIAGQHVLDVDQLEARRAARASPSRGRPGW